MSYVDNRIYAYENTGDQGSSYSKTSTNETRSHAINAINDENTSRTRVREPNGKHYGYKRTQCEVKSKNDMHDNGYFRCNELENDTDNELFALEDPPYLEDNAPFAIGHDYVSELNTPFTEVNTTYHEGQTPFSERNIKYIERNPKLTEEYAPIIEGQTPFSERNIKYIERNHKLTEDYAPSIEGQATFSKRNHFFSEENAPFSEDHSRFPNDDGDDEFWNARFAAIEGDEVMLRNHGQLKNTTAGHSSRESQPKQKYTEYSYNESIPTRHRIQPPDINSRFPTPPRKVPLTHQPGTSSEHCHLNQNQNQFNSQVRQNRVPIDLKTRPGILKKGTRKQSNEFPTPILESNITTCHRYNNNGNSYSSRCI